MDIRIFTKGTNNMGAHVSLIKLAYRPTYNINTILHHAKGSTVVCLVNSKGFYLYNTDVRTDPSYIDE